jgi:hypothetical protein
VVSDGERLVGLALEIKHRLSSTNRPAALVHRHPSSSRTDTALTRRGGLVVDTAGGVLGCWAVGLLGCWDVFH